MAANGQGEAGAHPPMSGGKKKNPFKEGRTMALSELLESMPKTAGNWSEVVESTATVDSSDQKGARTKPRPDLPDAPRTARSGPEVDTSKVPQEPPFLAFVGNLSYNVTERDLRTFFGPESVEDINFVLDRATGRPRGFAYVRFHTRDDLICALGKTGTMLMNRDIKVDVQTGGERRTNQTRQSSDARQQQYQSSGYQPPRTQQSYGSAQQDYNDGGAGQARDRQDSHSSQGPPPDPDHGGQQYQGYGAPQTGYRYDQQAQQSYGHREYAGRQTSYGGHSGAYNNSQSYRNSHHEGSHQNYDQGYQQPQDYNNYSEKRGNYDNYQQQQQTPYYDRRSSYPHGYSDSYQQQPHQHQYQQQRSVGDYRSQQSRGRGYDRGDNSYRQDYQPAQGRQYERASLPPQSAAESNDAPAAKIERKKLDLQPRTKSTDTPEAELPLEHKRSTSIFGGAKPVDTAAKEKEIEERLRRDREMHHKKEADGSKPLQENADPSAAPVGAARRRTSERTISQSSVEATADAPRLAPQKILQRPRPPPEAVPEAPLTEANEDGAQSNKPPLGGFKGGRNVRTFTRGGSSSARYQGSRDSQERVLQRSESERSNHGFAHRSGGQRAPRGAGRGAHSGKPPRNERPPRLQGQQRQGAAGSPKTQTAGADSDGWINKGKGQSADANHDGKGAERQRSQTPTNKRRNSQPKELPKLVDDKPVSFSNKNKFALLDEDVDE